LIKYLYIILLLSSCELSDSSAVDRVDRASYFRGKVLYINNCNGCHQQNGKGIGKLYPPLAKSDFLKHKPKKSIEYIYYGTNDAIIVNGKPFKFQMPDNKHLSHQDIADIMTYIGNSWSNKFLNTELKTVHEVLKK